LRGDGRISQVASFAFQGGERDGARYLLHALIFSTDRVTRKPEIKLGELCHVAVVKDSLA
jgi:hypothetical protein